MSDIELLLRQHNIKIPGFSPGRYFTTCPHCSHLRKSHHQRLKVLGVTITPDGRVYWGCNHCGDTGPQHGARDHLTHYDYGENRKVRGDDKRFSWEHLGDDGAWVSGAKNLPRAALYGIEQARLNGGYVLVVEGEKDARSLHDLGFNAVSGAHGAGKWTREHSEQLRGMDVIVLNDNDEQGYAHAAKIISCTLGVARRVRRLDLKDYWPGIGPGEDVSDWLDHGGGSEDWLARIVDELPELNGHAGEPAPTLPKLMWTSIAHDGKPVPEYAWSVTDRIPANQVCLFTGHGATGKSTIGLNLACAHVLGRDWLSSLPTPGPAFFLDAEDDASIIHRRLEAIRLHYGVTYQQLIDDGLHVLAMSGEDCVLAAPDNSGLIKPTKFYEQLLTAASDIKPAQIVIASAADVFGGNENDRSQVQQFMGLLKRIAIRTGGSVVLIAHPSQTGRANKEGFSGSTQWYNSVRAQIHIETVEGDSGEQTDSDLRELTFKKNQYGKKAHKIALTWKDGMFLPQPGLGTIEKAAADAAAEAVFISLMKKYIALHQPLSPNSFSRTYPPNVFAKDPDAAKMRKADLVEAMNRLIAKGTVVVKKWGTGTRQRDYLDLD